MSLGTRKRSRTCHCAKWWLNSKAWCIFSPHNTFCSSKKRLTGMACNGGSNHRMVSSLLSVMCARNLQMLHDTLAHCWTFSLAIDGAIHQSTSYLDARIRFQSENGIENCHLLASPMTDRHTGEEMFRMIVKVLDVTRPRLGGFSSRRCHRWGIEHDRATRVRRDVFRQ